MPINKVDWSTAILTHLHVAYVIKQFTKPKYLLSGPSPKCYNPQSKKKKKLLIYSITHRPSLIIYVKIGQFVSFFDETTRENFKDYEFILSMAFLKTFYQNFKSFYNYLPKVLMSLSHIFTATQGNLWNETKFGWSLTEPVFKTLYWKPLTV